MCVCCQSINQSINQNNNKKIAQKAAAELLNRGSTNAIITLGANGALVASRDADSSIAYTHAPAKASGAVVDTSGAGDSFIGALAFLIAEAKKKNEEVDLAKLTVKAVAIAGVSVTRKGTQASYATQAEAANL
jgi:ribokinase